MTTDNQAATYAAGRNTTTVDFQVSRRDDVHWAIEPVSTAAREVAAVFMTGDDPSRDLSIVAEHARSNALLLTLRSRGFSILYHGPAGPITL